MQEVTCHVLSTEDCGLTKEGLEDFIDFFQNYTDSVMLLKLDLVVITRTALAATVALLGADWSHLRDAVSKQEGPDSVGRWYNVCDTILRNSPGSDEIIMIERH